jgi:signal transduction histidine kinase
LGDRSRRLVERADAERVRGEDAARRAAAEERVRIARELHDVIAHSMSVIAVQAGTGRFVIDDSPEVAKDALASIEATSRGALEEMRRLLSVLRADGDDVAELTPAPGLADVASLVDDTAAVVPVELCIAGEPRPLPPGVDQCAYRIIQEALTNVRKHASARRAAVTISYLPEMLDLEIVDDGRGVAATASVADGHGLVGMRERASLYGGALEVGPRQGGGFRVHASLPLVDAS